MGRFFVAFLFLINFFSMRVVFSAADNACPICFESYQVACPNQTVAAALKNSCKLPCNHVFCLGCVHQCDIGRGCATCRSPYSLESAYLTNNANFVPKKLSLREHILESNSATTALAVTGCIAQGLMSGLVMDYCYTTNSKLNYIVCVSSLILTAYANVKLFRKIERSRLRDNIDRGARIAFLGGIGSALYLCATYDQMAGKVAMGGIAGGCSAWAALQLISS